MDQQLVLMSFAQALRYPDSRFLSSVSDIYSFSEKLGWESREGLSEFKKEVETKTFEEVEELFTSTFDIQALCYLDVGYVLFGEEYKRGEFLVQMSGLLRKFNIEAGTELADHLSVMLELVAAMPRGQERRELIQEAIVPALEKMVSEFGDPHTDEATADSPKEELTENVHLRPKKNFAYKKLLLSLKEFLKDDLRFEGTQKEKEEVGHA